MKVPLLDLKAQFAAIEPQVRAAIDRVLASQQFIMGPEVAALEREVAAYCGARHAVAVSSGTDAILCVLMCLDIGPDDEVIIPPFTFFSTAGCVARLGARPVFVDIEPRTFNMDPGKLEAAITPRTKAIMPVHLFGQCADMDAICGVADRRGIPVIEDAAQAVGATYKGRPAGTLGRVACFSFFPSKNLGAYGDAGMIVTDDAELAERLAVCRLHGSKPKYHHHFIGANFRLDALQAAILRAKLPHLERWHEARRRNAARYDELLAAPCGGVESPCGSAVTTPYIAPYNRPPAGGRSIYNQYVIRSPDRDGLQKHLTECGIGTEIYYPISLHLQKCFAYLVHREGDFPESERAQHEVLAIPIYPELTDEQITYVARCICEYPA